MGDGVRFTGLAGFVLQRGDGGCARVVFGTQPDPLGVAGGRRGADRGRGGGDQLGLPHLLGQPRDGVRGGLGSGLPSRGGLPLLRQLAQLDGQRGMELHPVVDLGDRRGTPLGLLVGGFQRLDRGNPLAGGAAGRGEVATVFAVDALDQQRLGTRQRGGVTRGQVEGPGQRITPRQVHRVGRRRLQNPLRMPQFGVHRLGQHGLHAVVCLVAAVLFAARRHNRQLCLGFLVEALVIDEVVNAGADFSGDLGSDIGMGRLDLLDFFFRRPIL